MTQIADGPLFDRLAAEVGAVELEMVERNQDGLGGPGPASKGMEVRVADRTGNRWT